MDNETENRLSHGLNRPIGLLRCQAIDVDLLRKEVAGAGLTCAAAMPISFGLDPPVEVSGAIVAPEACRASPPCVLLRYAEVGEFR